MRRLAIAVCVMISSGGCRGREAKREPSSAGAPVGPAAGLVLPAVGSAAFHLEIASVYERFQDAKSAVDHLSQAVKHSEDPVQRTHAYSALARVKEASGDHDGALEALERARAEIQKASTTHSAAGLPPGGPSAGAAGAEVLRRLAGLYSAKGRHEDALRLCSEGLARAREPWQRDEFVRLEIELRRANGTLDATIAEKELLLEKSPRDESALRFLAVALSSGGMPGPGLTPAGATAAGRPPGSGALLHVYERLYDLRPDDPQVRQILQSLLEAAGRIDDAVEIAATTPHARMECMGALALGPPPATLQGIAEGIRIRMRAGQREKARAEIEEMVSSGKRNGIAVYLVAADLLVDLGTPQRAFQLMAQAGREARSREDRRQVAFAQERSSARSGRVDDLKVTYERWRRSDDACLRAAATEREQQIAMFARSPAMGPPPPGP